MTRTGRRALPAILPLLAAIFALASCSASPQTPVQQAASLLSQAGATASGPAYTVTPSDSSDEYVVCSAGAAEADGTVQGGTEIVNVCVFPGNAQLQGYVTAGEYPAGAGMVQVGQYTLILVTDQGTLLGNPPPSLVQSVAGKTGGKVTAGG